MKGHGRKLIAPVVIAVIFALLLACYAAVALLLTEFSLLLGLLLGIPALALIGVVIFVLIERIKEIRNGEEDDLSQY